MEHIHNAATTSTALKPSNVSKGKGLGYIPAAVDRACANLDRVSRVRKKARNDSLACSMDWDVTSFEKVVDEMELKTCREHGSNSSQRASAKLCKLSRSYLISTGRDNGIWYMLTRIHLCQKFCQRQCSLKLILHLMKQRSIRICLMSLLSMT